MCCQGCSMFWVYGFQAELVHMATLNHCLNFDKWICRSFVIEKRLTGSSRGSVKAVTDSRSFEVSSALQSNYETLPVWLFSWKLASSTGSKLPPSVRQNCTRFELIENICKHREVNGGKLRKLESSFVWHLIKNPFLIQHNEIIVFGWINFQFSFPKWMSEWSGQLLRCSLNRESFEGTFCLNSVTRDLSFNLNDLFDYEICFRRFAII